MTAPPLSYRFPIVTNLRSRVVSKRYLASKTGGHRPNATRVHIPAIRLGKLERHEVMGSNPLLGTPLTSNLISPVASEIFSLKNGHARRLVRSDTHLKVATPGE